jgi:hypothetical protein
MDDLPKDYNLEQFAEALGMSTRWMRRKVAEGAAHQRCGHKIMFTVDQVQQLRADHTLEEVPESITTGPRWRRGEL